MGKLYLGIDQGTTVTTALLLNEQWQVVGRGQKEHRQIFPQPGWVEHDPVDIYESCLEAVRLALLQAHADPKDIYCIGMDHQGETCLLWDKRTGEPVYNAIVWQDRRTADIAEELKRTHGERIRRITGMIPDSYYSATKLRWVIDNVTGVKERIDRGELLAGTINTWLIWKFTGGASHVTDACSGVRLMLMDLEKGEWDKDLLDLMGIPREILPPIHNCNEIYGYTHPDAFFGVKVPIAGSISDSNAGIIGSGSTAPGTLKTSYGTGSFMTLITGNQVIYSKVGLMPCCCWKLSGVPSFSLTGAAYVAGAAIQWLRDGIRIINDAGETEAMAFSVEDTKDVYFVPAFAGLATPYWDQYARGIFVGLTGCIGREHLVRAVLEGIALQNMDGFRAMQSEYDGKITKMRADGGMVDNKFLMQFQADLLGIPVEVPLEKETSAMGSAFLAALTMGDLNSLADANPYVKYKCVFEPKMSDDEREFRLARYHQAVERSRGWAQK
ncbi:MAG: glycerol kinase GlpK [Bacillota bacterium]|jgi:glycerol kinase|nr:glycerol kinase GlpK [Bacillota bacterium]